MGRLVPVEDEYGPTGRLVEVPGPNDRTAAENIAGGAGRGAVTAFTFPGDVLGLIVNSAQKNPKYGVGAPPIPSVTDTVMPLARDAGIPVDYDPGSFPGKATDFVTGGLLWGGPSRFNQARKLAQEGTPFWRALAGQTGREVGQSVAAAGSSMVVENATKGMEDSLAKSSANFAAPMLPQLALLGLTGGVRGAFRGLGEGNRASFEDNANAFKAATGADATVGQAANNVRAVAAERALSFTGSGNFPLWQKGKEQAGQMRDRVASIIGGPNTSKTAAGNQISEGLFGQNGYVKQGLQATEALYDEMWKQVPAGTRMELGKSGALLDDFVNRYSKDPEFADILKDDMFERLQKAVAANKEARGGATVETIRALRSDIGKMIGKRSVIPGDAATGDLKQLYGALSEDLGEGMNKIGKKSASGTTPAYDAWKTADNGWKDYRDRVDNILSKLEGKSGEDLFLAIERKDDKALSQILGSLNVDDRKLVSQTIINNLGVETPANQRPMATAIEQVAGAVSDTVAPASHIFSPQRFLTKWNDLTPTTRAILVPDKATRKQLDEFATAIFKTSEGAKVIYNTSGTTGSGMLGAQLVALIGSLATGNIPLAAKVGTSLAGATWAAKKIVDPKFVKWLGQANKIPSVALPGHLSRLAKVDFGSDEENAQRDQFIAEMSQLINGAAP